MTRSVPDDIVQPFQVDPFALRGRLVRLGPALDKILTQHAYPDAVAALLGEAATLAVTLAGALKYEGIFTLQTKGDGPIRLVVADVTSSGALRGYAQFDEDKLAAALAAGPATVPRLLGSGYLAFTVDQGEFTERYQGIVELQGATLADCAHHYFRQSEQLEAGIKLAVGKIEGHWRAGGLMIQRLPAEGGEDRQAPDDFRPRALLGEELDEGWRRAIILMGSSTNQELLDPDLQPKDFLFRLFHEDGVRVYPEHGLAALCRCSRDRIETVLRNLPETDIEEMKVDRRIEVTCQFCNATQTFDDTELATLRASPAENSLAT